jgi:glutathione peroxidase
VAEFCSATYGTTFPIFVTIEDNGDGRHELYKAHVEAPTTRGVDAVEALLLR